MTNLEHPTVWQMMAAFASDEYELREIAPGEFEIVATLPTKKDETPNTTSDKVQNTAASGSPKGAVETIEAVR